MMGICISCLHDLNIPIYNDRSEEDIALTMRIRSYVESAL